MLILEHQIDIDARSVCKTAISGAKCLELIEENITENEEEYGEKWSDFYLVLMDCNMPFMDGYEATIKIRNLLFDYKLPQPIISAVTGHTEQEYLNKAFLSGMNQVLSKPVNHELLKDLC